MRHGRHRGRGAKRTRSRRPTSRNPRHAREESASKPFRTSRSRCGSHAFRRRRSIAGPKRRQRQHHDDGTVCCSQSDSPTALFGAFQLPRGALIHCRRPRPPRPECGRAQATHGRQQHPEPSTRTARHGQSPCRGVSAQPHPPSSRQPRSHGARAACPPQWLKPLQCDNEMGAAAAPR